MFINQPILSICIPTYNRCFFLKKTIESIVNQPEFIHTNNVEIVISDNASNDDTEEMCKFYTDLYPIKIKYSKNTKNILDGNFEKVLSLASGKYLKLNNDTLMHYPGSLNFLIDNIKNVRIDDTLLVFNASSIAKNLYDISLDELVKHLSYYSTWISLFGLSKKQFCEFRDVLKLKSNTQLCQTEVLLRIADIYKVTIIKCNEYFSSVDPIKKGGYDLITVFLKNYSSILKVYLLNKKLSKNTYRNEIQKVIFDFLLPLINSQLRGYNQYDFIFRNRFPKIIYYLIPNLKFVFKYLVFEFNLLKWRTNMLFKSFLMIFIK